MSPLSWYFFIFFLSRFIAVVSIVLYVIRALWPSVLQFQLPALLFVCVLFVVCTCMSDEPKKKQGRGLVDRKLVQAPSHFIVGRPKAALLFWFFSDFRCGMPLLIDILVIYKYKK